MNPVLQIKDLCRVFHGPRGQVQALAGLSLQVNHGEFVALQGPSGCGKTTLLLVAGALLSPSSGQVTVAGTNPYALSSGQRAAFRAENTGFVFQQFHLIPYFDVLENILARSLALPVPDARPRALELAARFGLENRLSHRPAELSTGECQRVALARALLGRPKLILADEPTGNLDDANGQAVLTSLADYARAGGAVLLVTHDATASRQVDRIQLMREGKLVEP